MKLLAGLRELVYNFTNPIEDANAPAVEISTDNFVAIARKSGMSQEAISELLKNRNGVEIVTKKKRDNISRTVNENSSKNSRSKTVKKEEKGIER